MIRDHRNNQGLFGQIRPFDAEKPDRIVYNCLGDKFKKTGGLLDTCLRWDKTDWYPIREEMT